MHGAESKNCIKKRPPGAGPGGKRREGKTERSAVWIHDFRVMDEGVPGVHEFIGGHLRDPFIWSEIFYNGAGGVQGNLANVREKLGVADAVDDEIHFVHGTILLMRCEVKPGPERFPVERKYRLCQERERSDEVGSENLIDFSGHGINLLQYCSRSETGGQVSREQRTNRETIYVYIGNHRTERLSC